MTTAADEMRAFMVNKRQRLVDKLCEVSDRIEASALGQKRSRLEGEIAEWDVQIAALPPAEPKPGPEAGRASAQAATWATMESPERNPSWHGRRQSKESRPLLPSTSAPATPASPLSSTARRERRRDGDAKRDPAVIGLRRPALCRPCPFKDDCRQFGRWCDHEGIPITGETDEV